MGNLEHPHQRSVNAGGMFVVLAVLVVGAILVAAGLAGLGFSYFSVQTRVATPTPLVVRVVNAKAEEASHPAVLTVEIDRQGQTYVDDQAMPLERIQAQFQERVQHSRMMSSEAAQVRVEEGCPAEHVDKVIAMFRELGFEDPGITTVPARRTVAIALDAAGEPSLDGQPVEDLQGALQEIAAEYGSRAAVILQVDPQCPYGAVVKAKALCEQRGLSKVTFLGAEAPSEAKPQP